VIIEKSTVPVSTCDFLRQTLLLSGALSGAFSVALAQLPLPCAISV